VYAVTRTTAYALSKKVHQRDRILFETPEFLVRTLSLSDIVLLLRDVFPPALNRLYTAHRPFISRAAERPEIIKYTLGIISETAKSILPIKPWQAMF